MKKVMMSTTKEDESLSCSNSFVHGIESVFHSTGRLIGRHPLLCVLLSTLVVAGCGAGLIRFHQETRREEIWVPYGSQALIDKNRVDQWFPSNQRIQRLLIESDNILDPVVLDYMVDIDKRIKNITLKDGDNWYSLCIRIGHQCYSTSIIELWSFDEDIIRNLTEADIIEKVNEDNLVSPVYYSHVDMKQLLGGLTNIETNDTELIQQANMATMSYFIIDQSSIDEDSGKYTDPIGDEWEQEFLDIAETSSDSNISVYRFTSMSYTEESTNAISSDFTFLASGYFLLIVYIMIATSKFTMVEHKVYVALAGITTVGFSTVAAIGLASACNLFYDYLHSVLPFLLLGIGVDDMFILIASLESLSDEQKKLSVQEQSGLTLKHAGVSIFVTSVTDLCAFLIGAVTILPALRSFCIYCALGVAFLFVLSIFFFMPFLTLDRRRVESKRDACCCCYTRGIKYKPSKCGQTSFLRDFVRNVYAPLLLKPATKIIVILTSVSLLGVCIWSAISWEQDFDYRTMILSDSYLKAYMDKSEEYFPTGVPTAFYLEHVDYHSEREVLNQFYQDIYDNQYIQEESIKCWFIDFQQWLRSGSIGNPNTSESVLDDWPADESAFFAKLEAFLSQPGQRYFADIVFDNSTDAHGILASRFIHANHIFLRDVNTEVAAMKSARHLANGTDFGYPNAAFVFSVAYYEYEANNVIERELFRNLGLASACIFIVISVLLGNVLASTLVFLCVLAVLVDIAGTLNFMGLTINTIVSVPLILSIGLAVDYSVHVAHDFMVQRGSRNGRVKTTLVIMGPAVVNGGISTLLAFILLALSKSYVFTTFFQIFLLVVIYGLFHGLAVLPVLLSLIGPASYQPDSCDDLKGYLHLQNTKPFYREKRCNSIELK